jgi:hypothetical protein
MAFPVNTRRVLTARLPGAAASGPALIRTALRTRTCIEATYNKQKILLAPHALYTRHGEPYVDGVVLQRDGQPPREAKLGAFKVDGLRMLVPAAVPFEPHDLLDRGADRYGEDAVLVAAA